jgi:hypothetical protein
MGRMDKLLAFVAELDRRRIARRLDSVREGAVMVEVHVPGSRWEVEFFGDGSVEVEVFRAAGGAASVMGGTEAEQAIAGLLDEEDEWEGAEEERALARGWTRGERRTGTPPTG